MREILFRGKRIDNGEWVYGYYVHIGPVSCKRAYIIPEYASATYVIEVSPSTVGQFTGMTDKNGKQIFEGDIIRHDGRMGAIQYYENFGMFMIYWIGGNGANMFVNIPHTEVEIIGNIHDNPELID